jgi:predicted amidohydrolase
MIKKNKGVRIAVAQFNAIRGDIDKNSYAQLELIKSASESGVDIIVFPELSLTGYELDISSSLKVSSVDTYNLKFKQISDKLNITSVIGVPVFDGLSLPKLGAIVFSPGKEPVTASKINLHQHELEYFTPSDSVVTFTIKGLVFGLAICADSLDERHISILDELGVDCCLAPSLITEKGYDNDLAILRKYAKKYDMCLAFSNYIGKSGGFSVTGKSAIINRSSQVVSQASVNELGFVYADI